MTEPVKLINLLKPTIIIPPFLGLQIIILDLSKLDNILNICYILLDMQH